LAISAAILLLAHLLQMQVQEVAILDLVQQLLLPLLIISLRVLLFSAVAVDLCLVLRHPLLGLGLQLLPTACPFNSVRLLHPHRLDWLAIQLCLLGVLHLLRQLLLSIQALLLELVLLLPLQMPTPIIP
jgi:hypothetical protein